ncbi:MAG: pyridoxamine 5'-phosphate oxidase family protein [Chloroflexota bacterium]
MSAFTRAEIEYMQTQRIGRIATLGRNGELHVVPLRFHYNPALDVIELLGGGMGTSKKYRDASATRQVAFVIDDWSDQGKPRGLEIRGHAETVPSGGDLILPRVDPQFIRLIPAYIASWGIDGDPFNPSGRRVG